MCVLLYMLQVKLKGKMCCLPQNMQHFCSCPGLGHWYCFVNKLGKGRKTPKKQPQMLRQLILKHTNVTFSGYKHTKSN